MIGSKILGEAYDQYNILYFIGFCLLASIYSPFFLSTLSNKALNQASKAKDSAVEANKKSMQAMSDAEKATKRGP